MDKWKIFIMLLLCMLHESRKEVVDHNKHENKTKRTIEKKSSRKLVLNLVIRYLVLISLVKIPKHRIVLHLGQYKSSVDGASLMKSWRSSSSHTYYKQHTKNTEYLEFSSQGSYMICIISLYAYTTLWPDLHTLLEVVIMLVGCHQLPQSTFLNTKVKSQFAYSECADGSRAKTTRIEESLNDTISIVGIFVIVI